MTDRIEALELADDRRYLKLGTLVALAAIVASSVYVASLTATGGLLSVAKMWIVWPDFAT